MDAKIVEKRFLKINKTLGVLTGIWPYQNRKARIIRITITFGLMLTAFVTQVAKIVTFYSIDDLVDSMPYMVASFGTFVKLANYVVNKSELKLLLDNLFEDWAAIKFKDDHDILLKYSKRGTMAVLFYLFHINATGVLFLSLPFIPSILDIIMPLNESRKHIFIYPAYYWFDSEKYYVLIIGHMMLIVCLLNCIFCGCDANYVYAVQHACGLLAIAGHKFKNACSNKKGEILPNKIIFGNVRRSIQDHQRAVKYLKQIEDSHRTYLFVSMFMLSTSISISLLKVAENDHHTQWVAHCMFFLAQLFHVFVLTVQGQFVVNELNEVYDAIYESEWYQSAPKIQALYKLALRSGLSPPILTAGGLINLNLRSFAEIVKASVSYYTVMQEKQR